MKVIDIICELCVFPRAGSEWVLLLVVLHVWIPGCLVVRHSLKAPSRQGGGIPRACTCAGARTVFTGQLAQMKDTMQRLVQAVCQAVWGTDRPEALKPTQRWWDTLKWKWDILYQVLSASPPFNVALWQALGSLGSRLKKKKKKTK